MKSIKALFLKQQSKNPFWGDYVCLIEAVRGRRFARKCLGIAMNKLIPESTSYESLEKKQYLDYLYNASNPLEEGKNK